MGKIHTVIGEIDPNELGVTYAHEHLLFCPPLPYSQQDPDLRLEGVETAIQEAYYFKQAGGRAIAEMSTVEMGRDPRGLASIAKAAKIHIIAATGFNKGKFCEPWVNDKTPEQLANDMVQDLTVGMSGTPIKAGLIKASSGKDVMSAGEKRVFMAAARAHLRTGAPVSTHTEAGTLAKEQIALLVDGGVKPAHILIGHLDRKLEEDYLLSIAKSGVFMGFDQISKEKYAPDIERIRMIKKLIEAGHENQIVLSGDLARMSYWPSNGFGKGPGLTYILWRFVPWMIEEGISRETAEKMLIHNPARLFSWVG